MLVVVDIALSSFVYPFVVVAVVHDLTQSSGPLFAIVMMIISILYTKKLSFRKAKGLPKIIQREWKCHDAEPDLSDPALLLIHAQVSRKFT